MFTFVRRYQLPFGLVLAAVVSSTSCSVYKHSTITPGKTIGIVEFFVLDEKLPTEFAWRVDIETLRRSGLEGKIIRLSKEDAKKVANGTAHTISTQKLQQVVLYLKSDYTKTLVNSTRIDLPFDQVASSVVYEFSPGKSTNQAILLSFGLMAVAIGILLAAACSCPNIYAENPDGILFEGDIFPGSTHPQLERHDWLPLSHLQPDGAVYQLQMRNEEPEIQHINLLELITADHPAGAIVLYDKYGRLHALAQRESPVVATDLEGHDVRPAILQEDSNPFRGNFNTTDPRAEDGLLLRFRRTPGARQAALVIRANTSSWLAYAHEQLQRDLGQYGPKVRQKFLEKDSAALQQWTLQQNIPLSVWLETSPGKWENADFFQLTGPKAPRRDVLLLDVSKVPGDELRIKLVTGFGFWEIDYVAVDFSSGPLVRTQVAPLVSATDQDGRDLNGLLRADDAQYYLQTKVGEAAQLRFSVPPLAANAERTLLLHTKGHYQIQREPVAGKPPRRFLRQFTRPDAFPKYAREQWKEMVGRDTLWTASQPR